MGTSYMRAWACAVGVLTVGSAMAQVNLVGTFGGTNGDKIGLSNVRVQRGSDSYLYQYDELVNANLGAINVPREGSSRTVLLYPDPLDGNRDKAMTDQFINTGLFDAGSGPGDFSSGSEGIRLDFEAPVRNGPGPDLLVMSIGFDFSSGSSSSPTDYFISFDGTSSHEIDADDVPEFRLFGLSDNIPYYARTGGVTSPEQLNEAAQITGFLGNSTATPVPVFQSLDLSDYGIGLGDAVNNIWLQDSSLISSRWFPTMVVGLPPVPEPTTALLLLVGSVGLLRRR